MFPPEDVYGTRKCIEFAAAALAELRPARVLDVGCGTGEKLTCPLAVAFPSTRFLGVDSDEATISYARSACASPNVEFRTGAGLDGEAAFDLVIASEVIEHVPSPVAFLRELKGRLAPGGCIVLTVPNGYGPSELASFVETLAALTGVLGLARALRRSLRPPRGAPPAARDTLAVSPHLNFFGWREVQRVLAAAGFRVRRYRPRILACGFIFDLLLRAEHRARWNAAVADRLPPRCVSGWMFVLEPAATGDDASEHARGPLARLRKWLNEKRWGLR